MAQADFDRRVALVRRFNRFYTKHIGVLREHLLGSPFSLTEARVIYELAHHERTTATELTRELGLDAGYLSRILRRFAKRGLIDRKTSKSDGRQRFLSLARPGQRAFAKLDRDSHEEIGAWLGRLPKASQHDLVAAMHTIDEVLRTEPEEKVSFVLRPHRPGDMGWVVGRHGALYAQEYGWDERFEALVAEIVAKFIRQYDAKRERCWIADVQGENAGCVFCVKESKTVARLRLLLVEPRARGLGIGTRLVNECLGFARAVGYRKITLWTNDVLDAARHIYEKTEFHLVQEEAHHSFGHDLVGQTWEREL